MRRPCIALMPLAGLVSGCEAAAPAPPPRPAEAVDVTMAPTDGEVELSATKFSVSGPARVPGLGAEGGHVVAPSNHLVAPYPGHGVLAEYLRGACHIGGFGTIRYTRKPLFCRELNAREHAP